MRLKRFYNYEDMTPIEQLLKENLKPVRPQPEFVSRLRHTLVHFKPEPPVLPQGWRTVLVSTAGIFSGILIAGAIVRMIAGLVGVLNLVRQARLPKAKRTAGVSPA